MNIELGWETIQKRADILGLNIFHKIHKYETRPLIRKCMPIQDIESEHHLRTKPVYKSFKNQGMKFKNSFFPHISSLWNSLPSDVQCKDTAEFKKYTNQELKPQKYKHFSRGYKNENALLTKIRVGRSDLNQHKFSIGLTDSPECLCHFREESPQHYFVDCFLYSLERQSLFTKIEHYIPNFNLQSKQTKLDIILRGLHIDNQELFKLNTTLTLAVQKFISQTKRFC